MSGAEVCSEDFQVVYIYENGLILPADYITGPIYECDVNGDASLG